MHQQSASADAEGTELRTELGPAYCVVAVSHSTKLVGSIGDLFGRGGAILVRET
ncbi:MAG: hypothetical protein ACAI18_05055 [Gemmatimonadales bacterium]